MGWSGYTHVIRKMIDDKKRSANSYLEDYFARQEKRRRVETETEQQQQQQTEDADAAITIVDSPDAPPPSPILDFEVNFPSPPPADKQPAPAHRYNKWFSDTAQTTALLFREGDGFVPDLSEPSTEEVAHLMKAAGGLRAQKALFSRPLLQFRNGSPAWKAHEPFGEKAILTSFNLVVKRKWWRSNGDVAFIELKNKATGERFMLSERYLDGWSDQNTEKLCAEYHSK
jgi:hypothetical protein